LTKGYHSSVKETLIEGKRNIEMNFLLLPIKFFSKLSENRQRKGIGIVRNFWDTSFENSKEVFF